jgi:threonine dehydratase
VQVPPQEEARFEAFLDEVGYPYWREDNNPAYELFLR